MMRCPSTCVVYVSRSSATSVAKDVTRGQPLLLTIFQEHVPAISYRYVDVDTCENCSNCLLRSISPVDWVDASRLRRKAEVQDEGMRVLSVGSNECDFYLA